MSYIYSIIIFTHYYFIFTYFRSRSTNIDNTLDVIFIINFKFYVVPGTPGAGRQ